MRRRRSRGEETGPIAAHASLFSLCVYLLAAACSRPLCLSDRARLFLTSPRLSLVSMYFYHSWNAELHATRRTTTLVLALLRGIIECVVPLASVVTGRAPSSE